MAPVFPFLEHHPATHHEPPPIGLESGAGPDEPVPAFGQMGEVLEAGDAVIPGIEDLAKLEARNKGYQVTESQLQDGSIKLQILEGTP